MKNFVREIGKNGEWIFRGKQNSGNYIHQVHEDIYYYLAPLVDSENSDRVKCVLTQENIKEDMKNLLDIELNIHHHNNSSLEYDKYLSKKSIQTLKEILSPDYYCIEKLYEWNALTDKQYNLLLNDT